MLDKTVWWVCALLEDHCCLTITDMRGEMAAHFSHEANGATMHYNSMCEKFVLTRFLYNLQKNIKNSDISERRICFYSTNLKKKKYFPRKLWKNCCSVTFDHFLGKGGVLSPKINLNFLKVRPHLHINTNEAGLGEAYTNICLDCNTRQNVVIRQASEWGSVPAFFAWKL